MDTNAVISKVRPTFPKRGPFFATLKERVDHYFESNRLNKRDSWRWYLKAVFLLTTYVFAYVQLVFFSESLIEALVWGSLVGQGIALIGFNVMHDAAHGAASRSKTVNRVFARAMDFIGGSVLLWKFKHNVLHHTYPNIHAWDEDLESGGLLRLSPDQPRKPWHRLQHIYAPALYGVLSAYWVFLSDYVELFRGKVSGHKVPRIGARQVAYFFAGKLFFMTYAVVIPLTVYEWPIVLAGVLGVQMLAGLILSLVFQFAHIVEEVGFPAPGKSGAIEEEWAVHQLTTTANFAPNNPIVNWYTGGLNHQVEHHLFPMVTHVHYPAINKIVRETCAEYDVPYLENTTVWSALKSHMTLLKRLGQSQAGSAKAA
jgi:linoleoyl-CoA desaturase